MADNGASGPWSRTDALLLSSISNSRRGSSLLDLMARSDALDKSYPTRDDLASSLGALHAAGLIERSERGVRRTRAGKALAKRTGFFGRYPDLLPHLQALPRSTTEWPVTDAEVDEAIGAYLARHQKG